MKYFYRCGFRIDGLNFVETNAVHYHRVTARVYFQLLEATVEINAIVTVAMVAEADRPHHNFILILIGKYLLAYMFVPVYQKNCGSRKKSSNCGSRLVTSVI